MATVVEGLAGKRILVVEDQYLLAADLKRSLEKFGATVIGPAATVERALALIRDAVPPLDAAILDINLEFGGTAYPVAEVLRAQNVPFVFATGYDRGSIRQDFDDVMNIGKPFNLRCFKRSVFP